MPDASPRKSGLAGEPIALRARELAIGPEALLGIFGELRTDAFPWLLDSALVDGRLARYSFAGSDPYLVARAFGPRLQLECRRPVVPGLEAGHWQMEGDPLALARAWMPRCPLLACPPELPATLPFLGGAIGCWGYELAEQMDAVRFHGRNELALPDLVLLFVDRVLAVDHLAERAYAIGMGIGENEAAAEALAAEACDAFSERVLQIASPPPAGGGRARRSAPNEEDVIARRRELLATPLPSALRASFDGPAYAGRVRSLKADIAAGNVYEANLTQRMEIEHEGDAWALYRILREQSPAPFACFIELPEGALLGSSPERFLCVDAAGRVETRPIKGTRPRGASPEQDRDLERELLASSKDRAENLMIVDLVRNDLGRVCEIGSIRVPELMVVERYASVFQLVSTVTGQLSEERDGFDLIRAAFPPGSMTGAPKIAAMRLLDALEPVRRGFYSGAVGYLDVRGGMDLSVVIRTLILQKGRAYLHVGGAVVADSDPDAEYRETLDKARAMLAALAVAAAGPE
jgi:para-aminobenzoate synthetase component 1